MLWGCLMSPHARLCAGNGPIAASERRSENGPIVCGRDTPWLAPPKPHNLTIQFVRFAVPSADQSVHMLHVSPFLQPQYLWGMAEVAGVNTAGVNIGRVSGRGRQRLRRFHGVKLSSIVTGL